ncbi:MAG: hypothetical protein ABSB79_03625 [Syntrophales bacterium]
MHTFQISSREDKNPNWLILGSYQVSEHHISIERKIPGAGTQEPDDPYKLAKNTAFAPIVGL